MTCPDDDRCLCRPWREAAQIGIENGVIFRSLELIGSDLWVAVGLDVRLNKLVVGQAKAHPADAIRELQIAILDNAG